MTTTPDRAAPAGGPPRPAEGRASRILPSPVTGQEIVLIGVIAVIWVVLALATPAFLTAGSIQPLLVATAPIALVGVGHDDHHHHRRHRRLGRRRDHGLLRARPPRRWSPRPRSPVGRAAVRRSSAACSALVNGAAHRLRPGARDHHHVRHRQPVPVPRAADLRLAARSTASRRRFDVLRPRRGRAHARRPARLRDHRAGQRARLVVPAAHRRRPALLRHRRRRARRPAGRGRRCSAGCCWPT